MKRRDRPRIFAEIINAIVEESNSNGEVKVTRIQSRVYVPFTRFKEYLVQMEKKGLLEKESMKVTEKGLKFLEQYRYFKSLLEKFGLE